MTVPTATVNFPIADHAEIECALRWPGRGVMLLCCAPLPQQSYRSPLTVTAKQQRISQGSAFDDLTRSLVVSGDLRSNTEICTAINQ
jgi:hypothetical protein